MTNDCYRFLFMKNKKLDIKIGSPWKKEKLENRIRDTCEAN